MNGHQLDRYRQRLWRQYRQALQRWSLMERLGLARESDDYCGSKDTHIEVVGIHDPWMDPWCCASHEAGRKHRAKGA